MTPLWEQRDELIKADTKLILQWLDLLDANGRESLMWSMLKRFTLPQLKAIHQHATEQIANELAKRGIFPDA